MSAMDINIDKDKLNQALKQFGSVLSKEDMNTVLNTLKNTNAAQLQKQMRAIDPKAVDSLLNSNPSLKKAVSSNPELAKNLNRVVSGNNKQG